MAVLAPTENRASTAGRFQAALLALFWPGVNQRSLRGLAVRSDRALPWIFCEFMNFDGGQHPPPGSRPRRGCPGLHLSVNLLGVVRRVI